MRKNNRTYRERRRERNSVARGSLEFKGWRWICPVCERPVKVLFHLLPARNVLRQYLPPMVEASVAALAAEAPHHAGFACWECHHVHNPSRGRRHFWGQIITYLTGGLLYGKEVPRPPEIKLERMRAYRPRMHAPAKRLEQVWELMTQGLTCRQIAEQLGMKEKTIKRYAYRLYKEKEVAPPKRVLKKEEIRDRLAAGQRYREIAEALGMKYQSVNAQVCKLRQEARQNVAGILNRGLTP
jgi:DNA-binding CsgD family transcriptional regulator